MKAVTRTLGPLGTLSMTTRTNRVAAVAVIMRAIAEHESISQGCISPAASAMHVCSGEISHSRFQDELLGLQDPRENLEHKNKTKSPDHHHLYHPHRHSPAPLVTPSIGPHHVQTNEIYKTHIGSSAILTVVLGNKRESKETGETDNSIPPPGSNWFGCPPPAHPSQSPAHTRPTSGSPSVHLQPTFSQPSAHVQPTPHKRL